MNLLSSFGFLLCCNYAPWMDGLLIGIPSTRSNLGKYIYIYILYMLDMPWGKTIYINSLYLIVRFLQFPINPVCQDSHMRQHGCAWFAIPCSSWVFMCLGWLGQCTKSPKSWLLCEKEIENLSDAIFSEPSLASGNIYFRSMGSTRRTFLRPQGWKDEKLKATRTGNRLARRLAYLSGPPGGKENT